MEINFLFKSYKYLVKEGGGIGRKISFRKMSTLTVRIGVDNNKA